CKQSPRPPSKGCSRTPPVFVRKLRKAAVGTGCDIRLRVSVGGQPAPSLCWYRNNDLLAPPGEKDVGGLWIRDCKASDAGLYTCVASNCLGEAQSSALLAHAGEHMFSIYFLKGAR
uniref:Ig-like domain-containing protein n=1 Tax=Hucho hucho TaxID=62062 RepID=A0A4W5PX15_9TELE